MPKIRDMAKVKQDKTEDKMDSGKSNFNRDVYMKNVYRLSKTLRSIKKTRKRNMDEGMA